MKYNSVVSIVEDLGTNSMDKCLEVIEKAFVKGEINDKFPVIDVKPKTILKDYRTIEDAYDDACEYVRNNKKEENYEEQ